MWYIGDSIDAAEPFISRIADARETIEGRVQRVLAYWHVVLQIKDILYFRP